MEIKKVHAGLDADKGYDVSRRRFFQLAGGIAGAGVLLSACHTTTKTSDVYLGSGDIALLNYLYVLQQVEAAFYTQAYATPYYGMNASELELLLDLRDQEIAHRELLKRILGTNAVPAISEDFSMVTFATRSSVLYYGIIIEDMMISGFNGVVHLFTNTDYALTVSKMVSVEARHSAYLRDLTAGNYFTDSKVVDGNGLSNAGSPSTVLANAQLFIHTKFDSSKLPN